MKAELVPLDGGAAIVLVKDLTVVGRNNEADVRLDRRSVSKVHCVLVKTDGFLFVRDLASTNGTKVNGQRVRRAALLPGDQLSIGGEKFHVRLGPDDALSTSHVKTHALLEPELEAADAAHSGEFDEPTPRQPKPTDDVGPRESFEPASGASPPFDPTSVEDGEGIVGAEREAPSSGTSSSLPVPGESDWPLPPESESAS